MNLVDSSAWIEYLQDSPRAGLFARRQCLEQAGRLPDALVARCMDVMRLGRVLDLTDSRAIAASQVARRHRLAMADAAMYSMACEFGATFWTQDVDYQGLSGVQYCPKLAPMDPTQ